MRNALQNIMYTHVGQECQDETGTRGKQSPTKMSNHSWGENLVRICVFPSLQCGHRAVDHWGGNLQAHQAYEAGHHIDATSTWKRVLKKSSGEHHGPCYLYGALFPGWFQWGTCNFTGWVAPHRDCAISMNPSGGADHQPLSSSHGDSSHWAGTSNGFADQEVAAGFEGPMPWVTVNASWHNLYGFHCGFSPSRLPESGCSGFASLDGVIICQLDGRSSPSTSSSVKVVKGSSAWHSSCTSPTNQQGLPGHGGWAFSTQYCRALVYAKVFCGCFMWYSCLPYMMLGIGKNWLHSRGWGAGGVE